MIAVVAIAGCANGTDNGAEVVPSTAPWAQRWTPGMQTGGRTPAAAGTALPPELAEVARNDPAAVAAAAMTLWFTWDTNRDSGPDDAAGRAAPLLTPSYAQSITAGAPQAGPGADWMAWRAQQARLVPAVRPGTEPVLPATPSTAYVQLEIDQAVTLPDGTVNRHVLTAVDVTLTRGAIGWEVADVEQR